MDATTAAGTTRWRDAPVVLEDYENLAQMVKAARKARDRFVEFDWVLTKEELLQLRRAVFEWGSGVVGRYKCFDAKVLAAINEALGDHTTVYVLAEPKNTSWLDYRVTCEGDGQFYHLRGHATFDILFGYGAAGIAERGAAKRFLSEGVREMLASSVSALGWNLPRLHQERFRGVRNALYSVPLSQGVSLDVKAPDGPVTGVPVHFQGPFSAMADADSPCLFTNEISKKKGVYLWTVNVGGQERPWYIGQTRRSFADRTAEHLAAVLSGSYLTMDAAAFARGENRRAVGAVVGAWPEKLPCFLANYENLVPDILGFIKVLRFHVAVLKGDGHLFDRVEGTLGRYFRSHPDKDLVDFFSPGIKVPAAIPHVAPVRLRFSADASIAGLPESLLT